MVKGSGNITGLYFLEAIIDLVIGGTELSLADFSFLAGVSLVASFATAAFGAGGGILSLASMALVLPPATLVPLNGIVQVGSNCGRAWLMREHIQWSVVPVFFVGTIIGAAVGGKFVITLPTTTLQIILAIFIIYAMWGPKFTASRPGKKTFFVVGIFAAFATMFVGATGPLLAPFTVASSDKRQEVVASHGALMTIQHGLKCIVFGLLGFAFGPYIPLLAAMLAAGFVGSFFGKMALNKLPEKAFRQIFKWGITLIAIRLLYKGIVG